MSSSTEKTNRALHILNTIDDVDLLIENIKNKSANEIPKVSFSTEEMASAEGQQKRLGVLKAETDKPMDILSGKKHFGDIKSFDGNIENYIGMTQYLPELLVLWVFLVRLQKEISLFLLLQAKVRL